MLVSLIVVAIFGAVITLAMAGVRVEGKGGEKVVKNVYVYLVLFATLMMTIGGSVGVFMGIADIIAPSPYHQSFEDFRRWGVERSIPEKEGVTISEAELKDRYEALVKAEELRQVARAKNSLVKSFGWIVIPFPIFLYFQRHLRKEEN